MQTVTILQKEIVKALEAGQDPAPILKELGELRAKLAAEGELAELQKVANERQALRDKAEAVKVLRAFVDELVGKVPDDVIGDDIPF